MLAISNLSKENAVAPISFTVTPQERLAIVGETGSGKSTLLKMVGGLIEPDTGEILFEGEKVIGPKRKLVPGHARIAYLSQHFELPKFIRVEEHLEPPFEISESEATQIFSKCRVTHLLDRDTMQLSGGEKQRVALAKLLLKRPGVLLLDEPFSNLDFNHKKIVKEVIEEVEQTLGLTIILVAHDPKDVLSWADRIMVLQHGELIQVANPTILYNQPVHAYVAGLFGSYSLITPGHWSLSMTNHHILDHKVLLRPNQIKVSSDPDAVRGDVISVSYYGYYDELLVQFRDDKIYVLAEPGEYAVGHRIGLRIGS